MITKIITWGLTKFYATKHRIRIRALFFLLGPEAAVNTLLAEVEDEADESPTYDLNPAEWRGKIVNVHLADPDTGLFDRLTSIPVNEYVARVLDCDEEETGLMDYRPEAVAGLISICMEASEADIDET